MILLYYKILAKIGTAAVQKTIAGGNSFGHGVV